MRGRSMALPFAVLFSLVFSQGLLGSPPRSRAVDKDPPAVTLIAPTAASRTFQVTVLATDKNGISKVFISIDGDVAAGRVQPPYEFSLTVTSFPVEVCAVADDAAGNSSVGAPLVYGEQFATLARSHAVGTDGRGNAHRPATLGYPFYLSSVCYGEKEPTGSGSPASS